MLTISRAVYDRIVEHANRDYPDEACGVVAGPAGSGRPERFIPMTNVARSPTFHEFDSGEQIRVWNEMDDRGEELVVIYHSHTMTEAKPSRTDIERAGFPEARYVIVSIADPEVADVRAFHIIDGQVTEEEVGVVPDGAPQPQASGVRGAAPQADAAGAE